MLLMPILRVHTALLGRTTLDGHVKYRMSPFMIGTTEVVMLTVYVVVLPLVRLTIVTLRPEKVFITFIDVEKPVPKSIKLED